VALGPGALGHVALSRAGWRGRRVLVTGHTGFKGGWLCTWLDALGAEVTGLARPAPDGPSFYAATALGSRMNSRIGDVCDASAVEDAYAGARPEVVFHLAAQALVRRSYREPLDTVATNVMGTAVVLDAARRRDTRAVVVVTSDKCYAPRSDGAPHREEDRLGGHDPYAASKAAAEIVTAALRDSFLAPRCGVATARAGNVIGGGDWGEDRLLPDAVRSIVQDGVMTVRSPDAVRPWQHVLDPLDGYLTLAERLLDAPAAWSEAWNFGPSPSPVSVQEVLSTFQRAWPALRWQSGGGGAEAAVLREQHVLQVDSSKARARLGWTPRLDTAAAVEAAVAWYRRWREGASCESLTELTKEQIAWHASLRPAA